MAGDLGSLVLSLSAETAQFRQDMQRANAIAGEHAQAMQKTFDGAKSAIQGALAGGVALYVKGLIDMAEETNKLSTRTGHAVEFLSELRIAAAASNVDVGELTGALGKFNVSLQEARKDGSALQGLMRALGVDITQGPTEAFRQFLRSANAIDDAAVKTSVFREAMGRTGDALIPLAGNFEQVMESARKMGGTLSTEVAANAERFNDALTVMLQVSKSVAVNALSPMIKTFADVAESINKAAERGEKWIQVFREGQKLAGAAVGGVGESIRDVPGLRPMGDMFRAGGEFVFNGATPLARGLPGWGGPLSIPAPFKPDAEVVNNALDHEAVKRKQAELKKLADERQKQNEDLLKKGVKSEEEAADARFKIAEQLYYDMGQLAKKELDARMELYKKADDSVLAGIVARTEVINEEAYQRGQDKLAQDKAMQKDADDQRIKQLRVIQQEARKGEDAARQLGLTFTSAFESAVMKGNSLRDVLKGLAQDVTAIFMRKTVSEPLAGAASGIFSGIMNGFNAPDYGGSAPPAVAAGFDFSMFGETGFANGGSFMVGGAGGTDSQHVAFRATPDERVTIETPAQQAARAGGDTYYIDARGADQTGLARLEAMIQGLGGRVAAMPGEIADMSRRSPGYRRQLLGA